MWGSNARGAIGVVDQDDQGEVLAEQFVSFFLLSLASHSFLTCSHLLISLLKW